MKYYWSPWIKQPKELFAVPDADDQKFPFAIQVREEFYEEAQREMESTEDEFGLPISPTDEFGLPL